MKPETYETYPGIVVSRRDIEAPWSDPWAAEKATADQSEKATAQVIRDANDRVTMRPERAEIRGVVTRKWLPQRPPAAEPPIEPQPGNLRDFSMLSCLMDERDIAKPELARCDAVLLAATEAWEKAKIALEQIEHQMRQELTRLSGLL